MEEREREVKMKEGITEREAEDESICRKDEWRVGGTEEDEKCSDTEKDLNRCGHEIGGEEDTERRTKIKM